MRATQHICIIAALGLSLVLAGCGNSGGGPSQPSGDNQAPTTEAAGRGASRLCPETSSGAVVVDAVPNLQPMTPVPAVGLELVADGFDRPLFVTGAGDGSGRLFVVEKGGRVQIVQQGERAPQPFLDIGHLVESTASERGLLRVHKETSSRYFVLRRN